MRTLSKPPYSSARRSQPAGDLLAAAVGLHPVPEVDVVVMLADVVDEAGVLAGERCDADLLDRLALQTRADDELVAVVDIGLVMLVVMELQCFRRHVGLQSVVGVWQVGEFEGHGTSPVRTVKAVWTSKGSRLGQRDCCGAQPNCAAPVKQVCGRLGSRKVVNGRVRSDTRYGAGRGSTRADCRKLRSGLRRASMPSVSPKLQEEPCVPIGWLHSTSPKIG